MGCSIRERAFTYPQSGIRYAMSVVTPAVVPVVSAASSSIVNVPFQKVATAIVQKRIDAIPARTAANVFGEMIVQPDRCFRMALTSSPRANISLSFRQCYVGQRLMPCRPGSKVLFCAYGTAFHPRCSACARSLVTSRRRPPGRDPSQSRIPLDDFASPACDLGHRPGAWRAGGAPLKSSWRKL